MVAPKYFFTEKHKYKNYFSRKCEKNKSKNVRAKEKEKSRQER